MPLLLEAITKGQIKIIKDLLVKSVDLTKTDEHGNTPLMLAILHEHPEIVRLLFAHQVDIHAANNEGQTAWSLAVFPGNAELIELLVQQGIPVDIRIFGWSALLIASKEGRLDIVKILIEYGADINAKVEEGSWKGYNVLIIAVHENHIDIVRFLTCNGVDLNETLDNRGWTALMWAAYTGLIEIAKILIERGADINVSVQDENWKGYTALMFASREGHFEIVRALVEHGAEIEAKMSHGGTALMIASLEGYFNIVAYLVDQGADIHAIDHDNQTALIAAVRGGHYEIIEYLLKKGSLVDSRYQNWTALMWAVKRGFIEIVTLLIEQGADINTTVEEEGWKGFTALMLAVYEGHLPLVRLLLERGADVNIRNDKGISPLMWATMSGYLDIVNFLTDYGAELDAKDQEGGTAATYAHQYRQRDILKILIKKGARPPFSKTSQWLKKGKIVLRLFMLPYLFPKMLYKFKKEPIARFQFSPDKSELQKNMHPGTMNLRWRYEIPETACITYGNLEKDGNPKIMVADNKKHLHILNINGNIENTIRLPAQFCYIECGWHQKHGLLLLGVSQKLSYLYVMDQHGKTLWKSLKWIGIDTTHWGDLNGDGNDEIVLSKIWPGKLVVLTAEGSILWKTPTISFFDFFNHPIDPVILPCGSGRQAFVLATSFNGIRVYDDAGKLLRILRPEGSYYPHSIATSVIDRDGRVQIVGTGSQMKDHELAYVIRAFDLAGNVVWKTPIDEASWFKGHVVCQDINGDGIREWIFMEMPGELVVVSPQGKKLAALSGQEGIEEVIIVPETSGYGFLVTRKNDTLKAYQFEKNGERS